MENRNHKHLPKGWENRENEQNKAYQRKVKSCNESTYTCGNYKRVATMCRTAQAQGTVTAKLSTQTRWLAKERTSDARHQDNSAAVAATPPTTTTTTVSNIANWWWSWWWMRTNTNGCTNRQTLQLSGVITRGKWRVATAVMPHHTILPQPTNTHTHTHA